MPETTKGKSTALAALKKRRANQPKQINNSDLRAGSSMYYYCKSCGHLAACLSETHTCPVPRLCEECDALKQMGWLE